MLCREVNAKSLSGFPTVEVLRPEADIRERWPVADPWSLALELWCSYPSRWIASRLEPSCGRPI